ncbi:MAG: hypothetical protein IJZ29_05415 [Clostridia bacterium]|nr:hypothetical protein [Clostridia bacterium]
MKIKRVFDCVSVLVGTIVGAGFATGNEIYQFFAKYGYISYILIAFFFICMFAFTYKIMLLANKHNAFTIDDLSKKVFGEKFAFFVNVVVYISFFIFASVMMSAMSNITGFIGVVVMSLLAFILCIKGKQGILVANQIILPLIFIFLFMLMANGFSFQPIHEVGFIGFLGIFGVLYYVSLNLLISLGSLLVVLHQVNKKELLCSAILGCLILSLLILIVVVILNNYNFASISMPLKDIALTKGTFLSLFTNIVLFCTIFTTFLSSAFGLYKKIKTDYKKPIFVFIIILLLCYIVSLTGFNCLVQYAYNIVGFLSLGVTICFLFANNKKN